MGQTFIEMAEKVRDFYQSIENFADIENRLVLYIVNEVVTDFNEKGITCFQEWLEYYSTEGNDFKDLVRFVHEYVYKITNDQLDDITLVEKIIGFNSIALYCKEMDIDGELEPTLSNRILNNFIQGICKYAEVLKGNLTIDGKLFISNFNIQQFVPTDLATTK